MYSSQTPIPTPAQMKENIYASLPRSLKSEVLVRARVETPEVQAERAETVKTKTVAELSQINSLSEFPLPKPIENLIHTEIKIDKIFEKPRFESLLFFNMGQPRPLFRLF